LLLLSCCRNLQANVLLAENDQLRSLNLQGVRGSVEGGSALGLRLDPNAPLQSEVLADLQEQLDVLRGENNLLIEQRSVLLSELENHQVALEAKSAELTQQGQQLFAAVADVAKLSQRVDQAENERDAAAAQALSYSDALGRSEVNPHVDLFSPCCCARYLWRIPSYEQNNQLYFVAFESLSLSHPLTSHVVTQVDHEALTEQLAAVTQRCREAEGLVQEYKRQLRSISTRGDDESNASVKRVQDAENRVRELHAALHGKTQELDATQEVLRKLRAEYQTTRQDAEGMLQVG
jgi:predicted nuclease with TOPRIM domain